MKKNIKKCLIILILFASFFILTFLIKKKQSIKVCLCVVAKLENNYIRDFVAHYQKYKIDKIFLYDNNDVDGEKMELVLSEYISTNLVEILNFRGINIKQKIIYQDCYTKNNQHFNWLLFYDVDEYIYMGNFKSIKDYLGQFQFSNCECIYLNWMTYSDNNLMYYDNRTIFQRFTSSFKNRTYRTWGKSILRGNITNITFGSVHTLYNKIIRCDGKGNICRLRGYACNKPDFDNFFINHFIYRSTEEMVNKFNKGDCVFRGPGWWSIKLSKIFSYLNENEVSMLKISFIAKYAKIKKEKLISLYKNKLIKEDYNFSHINK